MKSVHVEYVIRDGEDTVIHRMHVDRMSPYRVWLEWSQSKDMWMERISRDSAARVLRNARANECHAWSITRKVW